MKPVQFVLRLQFAEAMRTHSLSYEVFTALGGKLPETETEPVIERGVRLLLSKEKIAVLWLPTRCQIAVEDISDEKHCIDRIIAVLETIDGAVKIGKLNSRELLTYRILPTPQYDFVSLERKYREMMIAKNEVSDSVYDSSAILDIRRGKWILHHQSGAMEPKQLQKNYLTFKLDNMPKTFIFLQAGLIDTTMIEYSREEVYSFMETGQENCISHMDEFNRICEGHL